MQAELNDLLTQSGPGTRLGKLMRRYWQPAALVKEFEGDRPVRPVRLLGEELVLFRDEAGIYGLMDRHCAHRGADLCYGRLEDGGLRCPFHGWLFDVTGQCIEQPAEPEDSDYHQRIRLTRYPCIEKNGIIFAYMGEGEPPGFPGLDCFRAPDAYTFAFKGLIECNWLQALEVGIDPAHASFLHRFLEDEDPADGYGLQFRDAVAHTAMPMTQLMRDYTRPEIQVERTNYGLRLIALRRLKQDEMHVRVTNQVFPHAIVIPMSHEMTITQWHVPVDDTHCYWYAIFTSFGAPVDQDVMHQQRLELYELPDYRPRLNRHNQYGFNAAEQRTQTYTGMGHDINVHDQWAVESLGPIQDRTKEHLGRTDVGIIQYRRLLREALDQLEHDTGSLPLFGADGNVSEVNGLMAVDTITPVETWQAVWPEIDRKRREQSTWASGQG